MSKSRSVTDSRPKYPTYAASHAPSGDGPHYCIQPDGSVPLHIGDRFIYPGEEGHE